MKLNLDFLKTFTKIAEIGSFSKTAAKLGITQSAISQQMESLESYFGAKLFNRTIKGVNLTEEGKILLKKSKIILDNIEIVKNEIAKSLKDIKGTLRISASTIPGQHLLPKYITKFKELNPNVNFKIEVNDSAISLTKLLEDQADLASVGSLIGYDINKFETITLAEEELCFVVSKNHPLAKKNIINSEDFLDQTFIFRESTSGTRKESEKILKDLGISIDDLKIAFELTTTESILTAVSEGTGTSLISSIAASKSEAAGLIKCLKVPEKISAKRKLFLVKLKGKKFEKFIINSFWKFVKDFK
ncbi:MAG: LysR family transcriptional regulator [Candidatus Helarchaeota archaeon]|nr:LysR family transcriptional regulator [Candidatus Helarchaeota archaeon]